MNNDAVSVVASIIHDLHCGDIQPCRRWKVDPRHREYYQERARNIMDKLGPEIGPANVSKAVEVILEELD